MLNKENIIKELQEIGISDVENCIISIERNDCQNCEFSGDCYAFGASWLFPDVE